MPGITRTFSLFSVLRMIGALQPLSPPSPVPRFQSGGIDYQAGGPDFNPLAPQVINKAVMRSLI